MLNVEKWAQGKQTLFALSAIQLVTMADSLYEVIPQAKDRQLFGHQFSMPELTSWFNMYQSPLKPIKAFGNFVANFHEYGEQLLIFLFAARKLHKLLKKNPDYFKENPITLENAQQGRNHANSLSAFIFSEIKDDIDPQPVNPDEKAKILEYIRKNEQELGFCFFLFVPCAFIFQTSPNVLYRKAVAGDIDSIEKLLKLDPLLQHDPAIGQQIQHLRFSNKTNDYERVAAAIHKPAMTNYSDIADARKSAKVKIAAIISELSQLAGQPLSHAQIADLFDAYAKDKREDEIDTDLPAEESLRTAIKRHSPPWHNLFQNLDNKK
jgi:hypothetical protein